MSCGNIIPNERLNKLILHKLDGRGLLIKVTMTLNCESESKEWCFKSHVKNSVLPSKSVSLFTSTVYINWSKYTTQVTDIIQNKQNKTHIQKIKMQI